MVKYIFEDDEAVLYYYRNLSLCIDNELIVQISNNNVISKNEDDDVLLEDFNDWLKEIGISNRELTRFMKNYLKIYKLKICNRVDMNLSTLFLVNIKIIYLS